MNKHENVSFFVIDPFVDYFAVLYNIDHLEPIDKMLNHLYFDNNTSHPYCCNDTYHLEQLHRHDDRSYYHIDSYHVANIANFFEKT